MWPYGAVVCAVDFQLKHCGFDPRRVRFHTSFFSFSISGWLPTAKCVCLSVRGGNFVRFYRFPSFTLRFILRHTIVQRPTMTCADTAHSDTAHNSMYLSPLIANIINTVLEANRDASQGIGVGTLVPLAKPGKPLGPTHKPQTDCSPEHDQEGSIFSRCEEDSANSGATLGPSTVILATMT